MPYAYRQNCRVWSFAFLRLSCPCHRYPPQFPTCPPAQDQPWDSVTSFLCLYSANSSERRTDWERLFYPAPDRFAPSGVNSNFFLCIFAAQSRRKQSSLHFGVYKFRIVVQKILKFLVPLFIICGKLFPFCLVGGINKSLRQLAEALYIRLYFTSLMLLTAADSVSIACFLFTFTLTPPFAQTQTTRPF